MFQAALKPKARLGQGRLQVMAVKAVVFRVQKEPPGQEVLIELGVKLLQEVNAAGLEHPGDFPQTSPPIRQMVEHPETEDRVQDPVPVGESQGITHIEGNLLLVFRLEVSPGQEDHPLVQVEGVQARGLKLLPG